jgi:RNA polymerase sigma-70 factor (ECF subfamily)
VAIDALTEGASCASDPSDQERAAFEELYAATYRRLVALCRRLLGGSGDAEGVAQEAFLRAWRAWDSYSSTRPFWPWVATIARRLCVDHYRVQAGTAVALRNGGLPHRTEPAPEDVVEEREDRRLAVAALRSLSPAEQRLVRLREVAGWSYEEMARSEGVTVESIRASLRRARVRLRQAHARLTDRPANAANTTNPDTDVRFLRIYGNGA